MAYRFRHRYSWDLTGVKNPAHKQVVQDALNACDAPFSRIRRNTGKRVPVTVSDLGRFNELMPDDGHMHVHGRGDVGHLLGDPKRRAALGLYWLPSAVHPAGRVELDAGIMGDRPLAQEVFLAEAAHALDYGAMTDRQRDEVEALFEHAHSGHEHEGWFEEQGEQNYWAWRGERWMGLFMAAFAPSLPRPLERRQPWHWSYDESDVRAVRRLLK